MMRRPGRLFLLIGALTFLALLGGRTAVELYTDALWFQDMGYSPVFWTRLVASLGVRALTGAIAAAIVLVNLWTVARKLGPIHLRRKYGNLEIAEQIPRVYVIGGIAITGVLAGWWLSGLAFGNANALHVLAWVRQVEWGVSDPLFGRDLSFYVFSLPVYFRFIDHLLLTALWSVALVLLGYVLAGSIRWHDRRLLVAEETRMHFVVLAAIVVLLLGVRYWLGRYELLLDGTGIGGGLGYTDVTARLPARRILAILALVTGGALVYGALRQTWVPALVGLGGLGAAALLLGQLYPAFVQKFQVEPNELAREAPYIEWNMEFTRRAYDLHDLRRYSMAYDPGPLPEWEELEPVVAQVPLWDPEPLRTTFNQVESIRDYYRFADVDYDRYGEGEERTQVAVAVREFHLDGLPEPARTWQTLRLNPRYVRGVGAVVSPAATSTPSGEPYRWLRNLDPVVRTEGAPAYLELTEPSVFYGEAMGRRGQGHEYVILDSRRDSTLSGDTIGTAPPGIQLGSLPRMLAFAWRFRDKNLLFSGELSEESRFVFRRSIHERVREIAPFLFWDPDAQPVISGGRIHWILDGYVASSTYPLARRLEFPAAGSIRYLRNSVKAVVDAVTGRVTLYRVDDDDPILATYARIFPGLIEPQSEMPAELRAHLRYPTLFLLAQAEILKEYHVDEPLAFYAGQDLWQLPHGFGSAAAVYRPIHSLMKLPAEDDVEFLLPIPFIARGRQNMTALLVARNDPPNYGQLVLLELPRDQQVPGPNQVAALMEQDPAISPQLSLWRQAGSEVNLGYLRVLPLEDAFLYLQPIFLSARESSIPELARVVASDGRSVTMATSLEEAVRQLRSPMDPPRAEARGEGGEAPAMPGVEGEWSRRALELMNEAEQRLRSGDWAGFGERWNALRAWLQRSRPNER